MAAYFFDTSALVKRYSRETGTAWMLGLFRRAAGHRLYVVRVTGVEAAAALTRKRRGGRNRRSAPVVLIDDQELMRPRVVILNDNARGRGE